MLISPCEVFAFIVIFSCSRATVATSAINISSNSTTIAYHYAFPLVLMEATRKAMRIPSNFLLSKQTFPTPSEHNVIRPNRDTLYTIAWLDLSRGPLKLHLENTEGSSGRYYMFPILDAFTNVVSSPGWRTTEKKDGTFIIRRSQSNNTFVNNATIDVPTNLAWILGRTNVHGEKDLPTVIQQQKKYHLEHSLTQLRTHTTKNHQEGSSQDLAAPPDDVLAMSAKDFFTQFSELLKSNPPTMADQKIISELTQYGLNPGETLDWDSLPTASKQAWEMGKTNGQQQMFNFSRVKVNGWTLTQNNTGKYGTDYLYRAVVSLVGLGANEPADAVYYNSEEFDGTKSWKLLFQPNQSPPNHAFWSLTMYDTKGYLVENSLKRYDVGSESDYLITRSDGSIEITMQGDDPKSSTTNWLPTPSNSSNFTMTLRVYWPADDILSGDWKPPYVLPTK